MTGPARLIRLVRDAVPTAGPAATDTDLLQRYAAARDEAAFAELVRRNGPLVLRTCRHILGQAHADDAFQAVFLLLARSAGRLTRTGSLAGWLHVSAVRIGAPEAQKVLAALAAGAPEATQTRDAASALGRLAARR